MSRRLTAVLLVSIASCGMPDRRAPGGTVRPAPLAAPNERVPQDAEKIAERYRADPHAPRVEVLSPDEAAARLGDPRPADPSTVVQVNY